VRSDDIKYHCWLHGYNDNHNNDIYKRMVQGHLSTTTIYIGTNGNTVNNKCSMLPSQVNLGGRSKAKTMAVGGNSGNHTSLMSMWNQ
jgi:hypothetical protein